MQTLKIQLIETISSNDYHWQYTERSSLLNVVMAIRVKKVSITRALLLFNLSFI